MNPDEKSLDHLRPTDKNPRILMQQNSEKLDRSIDELGPVDGIVFNVNPDINELVSGNQRTNKFKQSQDAKVVITHRFAEPTTTGTMAYGYVEFEGERWPYREVFWDKTTHSKGVLLANQHAGEEDKDLLAERYAELLTLDESALDVLFITDDEVDSLQDGWVDHEDLEDEPKDKTKRYTIDQLKELREKFVAERGMPDNGLIDWIAEREK